MYRERLNQHYNVWELSDQVNGHVRLERKGAEPWHGTHLAFRLNSPYYRRFLRGFPF